MGVVIMVLVIMVVWRGGSNGADGYGNFDGMER